MVKVVAGVTAPALMATKATAMMNRAQISHGAS